MTPEQASSYVMAQTVCALAEVESMKAANQEREGQGYALAYDEAAFLSIPDKYGIHHNAICALFQDANS